MSDPVKTAMRIPVTQTSERAGQSKDFRRSSELRARFSDVYALYKRGDAETALDELQLILEYAESDDLRLADWLLLPTYLQYMNQTKKAWKVINILRQRRQDWSSQCEIAEKMCKVARSANDRTRLYAAMMWISCCEGLARLEEVDSEFESLGLTEKEYVSLWFSICGEGRPVKPVASADKHLTQHSNKLWIHACSIDFDSLHLRLQNYAHRLGLPFDERLTEALIHYRLSQRDLRFEGVLKIVRRHIVRDKITTWRW
tara:strand:- start:1396 stop:2169 length:774 start_codon:yes stop_codon:yes gene_type:complete